MSKGYWRTQRERKKKEYPVSSLTIGLECGGSDAFSGITANPAVGNVSDRIIDAGGVVILTETTEMIGTGHILKRRAASSEVAEQIDKIVSDTEAETKRVLGQFAKVAISPGNMDGGISSIREKSLGCIIKGGSRPISQVVAYGEMPLKKGLAIMNGPGYDVDSMTGLAAGGAQAIIFTTGMGNPIGFPGIPVIKVASTSAMFSKMEDDMDVNAGTIVDGKSIEEVGGDIYKLLLDVLNGKKTKAESNRQDGILCIYTTHCAF